MRDMLHLCVVCCASPGVVVVPTFFLHASFWGISCLANIDLLQVVVSGLVCVWVCVTRCICVACVVLAYGLVLAPVFFTLRPVLLSSCVADIKVFQVAASGLLCIWICVVLVLFEVIVAPTFCSCVHLGRYHVSLLSICFRLC